MYASTDFLFPDVRDRRLGFCNSEKEEEEMIL
jgi:hypothetical protein